VRRRCPAIRRNAHAGEKPVSICRCADKYRRRTVDARVDLVVERVVHDVDPVWRLRPTFATVRCSAGRGGGGEPVAAGARAGTAPATRASNITPGTVFLIGPRRCCRCVRVSHIAKRVESSGESRYLAHMTQERTLQPPDRDLGEDRAIPRRDFLQGALAAAATTLAGPLLKAYAADAPWRTNPLRKIRQVTIPGADGLRGSHPDHSRCSRAARWAQPGSARYRRVVRSRRRRGRNQRVVGRTFLPGPHSPTSRICFSTITMTSADTRGATSFNSGAPAAAERGHAGNRQPAPYAAVPAGLLKELASTWRHQLEVEHPNSIVPRSSSWRVLRSRDIRG